MKMLCVCALAVAAWASDRPGVIVARIPRAVTAAASLTDFECMRDKIGEQGAVLDWPMDGRQVYIEGVDGNYVVVETGLDDFGAASIGHTRTPCISDVPSSLMLTFDPPVESWQMQIARDDEGELRAVCWTDVNDIGDESKGVVFESSPSDDVLPVGRYSRPGTVACAVQAVVDNIMVY